MRINEQIRISPVRLIGANGEQLGVVPTQQAMDLAREANLDLVEVAANERPPVCKILDYGKLRYQQSRKGGKVHQQKLKEIRVRPKTGEHDVDTKVNQARKFLEHNDKVLVNVLFLQPGPHPAPLVQSRIGSVPVPAPAPPPGVVLASAGSTAAATAFPPRTPGASA